MEKERSIQSHEKIFRHLPASVSDGRWLTKRELARHLRYSERWVELRVREGMPHLRVGGQLRFRPSEVEAYFGDLEVIR